MNVVHPIADKIVAIIAARRGVPVYVGELLPLGTRAAVDQALARLVRQGRLLRVGRGLYAWPRVSPALKLPVTPSVDELVRGWARQHGLRILPFGPQAANLLGLSTQVPARYVYYTNGRTQRVRLGGTDVQFLNRGPKTMEVRGAHTALLFQALRHLGRARMRPELLERVRLSLRPPDRTAIRRNLPRAPAWLRAVLEQLIEEPAAHG